MRTNPIFIIGPPRSGTSLTASVFEACGLWLGECAGSAPDNPHGFFENAAMRALDRQMLESAGFDPAGVAPIPHENWPTRDEGLDVYAHGLRESVDRILEIQRFPDRAQWGFKDPKLLLTWRIWVAAFPEARTVLVHRSIESAATSCARAGFFAGRSIDWTQWIREQVRRMQRIDRSDVRHVADVFPAEMKSSPTSMRSAVEKAELRWSDDAARLFDPLLWTAG